MEVQIGILECIGKRGQSIISYFVIMMQKLPWDGTDFEVFVTFYILFDLGTLFIYWLSVIIFNYSLVLVVVSLSADIVVPLSILAAIVLVLVGLSTVVIVACVYNRAKLIKCYQKWNPSSNKKYMGFT